MISLTTAPAALTTRLQCLMGEGEGEGEGTYRRKTSVEEVNLVSVRFGTAWEDMVGDSGARESV